MELHTIGNTSFLDNINYLIYYSLYILFKILCPSYFHIIVLVIYFKTGLLAARSSVPTPGAALLPAEHISISRPQIFASGSRGEREAGKWSNQVALILLHGGEQEGGGGDSHN